MKKITSIISVLLSIIIMVSLFILNMIPDKYLLLIGGVLLIINIISIFLVHRKNIILIIFGYLFFLIICIGSVVGIYYVGNTTKLFNNLNEVKEKSIYYIVVNKNSNYKGLKDLNDKKIGTIKSDSTNYKKALKDIEKNIKISNKDYNNMQYESDNLCKEYEGTVYYNRLILGQWCNAEGLIYRQFADNPDLFIKDKAVDENGNKLNFMIISIGIDYGASEGETEFKATGITTMFKQAWTIDEEKLTGLHTPEQMYEKFVEFYRRVVKEYGKVTHVFADYGALGQVLTFGMNKYLQQHGIPLQVQDCIKGRIVDRIELDCSLFGQCRRFILRKCKYLIEAYTQALWDEKKEDERLDDGTTPIDDLDASEYSMFPFYDKLMMNMR